jgi:2-polyprenyl-3-methyl-5-hydroxy-6-metoxy-1,4-benzoquinol methylase
MYEREYEAMYSLETFYWWYVARRGLANELLTKELRGRRNVRILDVGCGTGANMSAFARHGIITGIDASMDALEFCQLRGLNSVALSSVECLPFDDDTFDVVVAMDILEHTDDDLMALKELQRVCRKDGLLFVTVPAYGFLWSEHDEALKHRRRYAAHELRNKMTISGFDVDRTSYFITALFFPILAIRFWQGIFKRSTHPKTSLHVPPRWINTLLIKLLGLEQRIFRCMNLPFGVSIVALARPCEKSIRSVLTDVDLARLFSMDSEPVPTGEFKG